MTAAASASFQVALTGLKDGHIAEEVAPRLARLFTQPPEKMLAILDGRRRVLKQGLSEADARKYEAALSGAGCTCAVAAAAGVPGRRDVAAAATAVLAAKSAAYRERQAQFMQRELAAGQRLVIDVVIVHGIYLILLRHLGPAFGLAGWFAVAGVMCYALFRLCRGLGYAHRKRDRLMGLMLVPVAGLMALGVLSHKAAQK